MASWLDNASAQALTNQCMDAPMYVRMHKQTIQKHNASHPNYRMGRGTNIIIMVYAGASDHSNTDPVQLIRSLEATKCHLHHGTKLVCVCVKLNLHTRLRTWNVVEQHQQLNTDVLLQRQDFHTIAVLQDAFRETTAVFHSLNGLLYAVEHVHDGQLIGRMNFVKLLQQFFLYSKCRTVFTNSMCTFSQLSPTFTYFRKAEVDSWESKDAGFFYKSRFAGIEDNQPLSLYVITQWQSHQSLVASSVLEVTSCIYCSNSVTMQLSISTHNATITMQINCVWNAVAGF